MEEVFILFVTLALIFCLYFAENHSIRRFWHEYCYISTYMEKTTHRLVFSAKYKQKIRANASSQERTWLWTQKVQISRSQTMWNTTSILYISTVMNAIWILKIKQKFWIISRQLIHFTQLPFWGSTDIKEPKEPKRSQRSSSKIKKSLS